MRFPSRRFRRIDSDHSAQSLLLRASVRTLGLFVTGAVGLAAQNATSDDVQGVAVTVEVQGGGVAPAIFPGTRAEAAAATGGDFHFDDVVDALHVMTPGTLWRLEDDADEPDARPGLAILVQPDDGSSFPGRFFGPAELAREASRVWAEAQGTPLPAPDQAPVLPEGNARVQAIPLGTAVRTLQASPSP